MPRSVGGTVEQWSVAMVGSGMTVVHYNARMRCAENMDHVEMSGVEVSGVERKIVTIKNGVLDIRGSAKNGTK